MNSRRWFLYPLLTLWLCALFAPALGQGNAMELQQRAIVRLDAAIKVLRDTGDMAGIRAEFQQAERELAASNQLLKAGKKWAPLALGLIKQGHLRRLGTLGSPEDQKPGRDAALRFYRQAEQAARYAGHTAHQASALAWASMIGAHNMGQALADARQALHLAGKTADNDVIAHALDVLGSAQLAQGDLPGASATFNRAVAVAAKAKDPMASYYAFFHRADMYRKSAQRCDFERVFEPCLQDLDRASADYQKALAIVRARGHAALATQTEQLIVGLDQRRTLINMSERFHRSLVKPKLFRPTKPGDVFVTERFIPPQSDVSPALLQYYQEAKRAGVFADNHYLEGLTNELLGRNDTALEHYLDAVEALRLDRRSLRDERARGTVLEDRMEIYYAPMLHLLERRRHAEAFALLEHSRARAMAELLATRSLGLARLREQELYAEWMTLRSRIADMQSELFQLTPQSDAMPEPPKISKLQGRIGELHAEERNLHQRIADEAPKILSLAERPPVTLKELQRSMREERYEMLQYLVLEHGIVLWHIAADRVVVRKVILPRSALLHRVGLLQKSLIDREATFDDTTARELFLYLVQPVLAGVRAKRLVIVAHDDLGSIPFQALRNPADGRYLGEHLQISYAPSASVFLGLQRSPSVVGGRLLAIADPEIDTARDGVRGIAKLFPDRSKVVTDKLPSVAEVKSWVADFDVIHFSVHGVFAPGEPLLSYLELAPADAPAGRLTAAEMFGLRLTDNRLVVLAACESGRAEVTRSNELLGMVRALLYAGAGTLVLSSWKVDPAATTLWMQAFYEAAQSKPPAEAARSALLHVKAQPKYSHPYYWAAFTMIGR